MFILIIGESEKINYDSVSDIDDSNIDLEEYVRGGMLSYYSLFVLLDFLIKIVYYY